MLGNYSSQILSFRTEFTRLQVFKHCSCMRPEEGALFVTVHAAKAPDIAGPARRPEESEPPERIAAQGH
jgi:hypothetical protein